VTLSRYSVLALLLVGGAGCSQTDRDTSADTSSPAIVLATAADSLAFRAYSASGGAAWKEAPLVSFVFGSARDGQYVPRRKHCWNRSTGEYRLEQPIGTDSTLVVLFSTWTREGRAFINGEPVAAAESAEYVARAHRSHINDEYWLAMPMKLFDEGVARTLVPDSADAETEVVQLSFEKVGYTPGDRYWVHIDRETGLVRRWTFLLEGRDTPGTYSWEGYESFETPMGRIMMSNEKRGSTTSIMTNQVAFPQAVPDGMFTDPRPMM
jgi:hypothetical protein